MTISNSELVLIAPDEKGRYHAVHTKLLLNDASQHEGRTLIFTDGTKFDVAVSFGIVFPDFTW